jgi:hypothetical protein
VRKVRVNYLMTFALDKRFCDMVSYISVCVCKGKKVKLSLCLTKHHVMKAYREAEV